MKKSLVIGGMLAFALISVMGLLGCASVDQQTLKKEGVPQDQWATVYWVFDDSKLESLDGKKQGWFVPNLYGLLGPLRGQFKERPNTETPFLENGRKVQVSPGEHTFIISEKALIGRKKYTGTFKFEAGKKYVIQLVNPSVYESMQKEGFDWAKDLAKDFGNSLKEDLAGNKIMIMAESKKAVPTFPDYSLKGSDWKKSIK